MSIQIQLRNDTAANWTTINPVLAQGEMGVENDTFKFKIGNGSTAWASLAYASSILGYTAENTANKGAASGYAGLDAFKRVLDSGEVILVKVTQEMLADMIGTTRGRVSFFMNKFRRLGLIDYNNNGKRNRDEFHYAATGRRSDHRWQPNANGNGYHKQYQPFGSG